MKSIDFLPQRYRDQNVRRKAGAWRLLVCALFGGAIVIASIGQFWQRRQVQARLVEIQPLLAETQALSDRLSQMQGELSRVTQRANVCALLQCRWRQRQIVASIVKPLPDSIRMEELHIAKRSSGETKPNFSFNSEASSPAEQLPPAARDAGDLEKRLRDGQTVATLTGVTADVAALHVYLEHLESQPLVARVELLSVENAKSPAARGQQQFVAEVQIESPLAAAGKESVVDRSAIHLAGRPAISDDTEHAP